MSQSSQIADSDALKRIVRMTRDGSVRIDQKYNVPGSGAGTDVTGRYWILGIIHVHAGTIRFRHGDRWIAPKSNPFAMFIPPYHIIEAELAGLASENHGIASSQLLPTFAPKDAVIYDPMDMACPESLVELNGILRIRKDEQGISRAPLASATANKIKRAIEAAYGDSCKISEIARQLKLKPNVLANHFKDSYGMSPVNYRNWLRVMDAMMQLMEGKAIVDVAQEVGFEDLSRFYKQFKKIAAGPPARYQRVGMKSEKTPRRDPPEMR